MSEELIDLKCEDCGVDYKKPASFIGISNVYFRWSLLYCDDCRKKKELQSLRFLPKVLKALASVEDEEKRAKEIELENQVIALEQKKKDWEESYSEIDWEVFRDSYFQCDKCKTWDNQQCICYAR
jgi:hypothetical protein